MTKPLSLPVTSWVKITGRDGLILATIDSGNYDGDDPDDLMGQPVILDGRTYEVRAVETFAIPRSAEHPYRLTFGLLVDDVFATP